MPRFVRILLQGGDDVTDAVVERLGVPSAEAEPLKRDPAELGAARTPVTRPASSTPSSTSSSTRSAARSTTTWPPPAAGRSAGSCSPAAASLAPGLAEKLAEAVRAPVEYGRAFSRSRSARPGWHPSRSDSSNRWQPCRSALHWEPCDGQLQGARARPTRRMAWTRSRPGACPARPPGRVPAGEPAAAGDRRGGEGQAGKARPRRCRRRVRGRWSAAMFVIANGQVRPRRTSVDVATAAGAALQAQVQQYAEVPRVMAEVAAAEEQLSTAMAGEVRWSYVFNDLALTIPKNVSLISLAGTVSPTAPGAVPLRPGRRSHPARQACWAARDRDRDLQRRGEVATTPLRPGSTRSPSRRTTWIPMCQRRPRRRPTPPPSTPRQ